MARSFLASCWPWALPFSHPRYICTSILPNIPPLFSLLFKENSQFIQLSTKYGVRILRVKSIWEALLFDVLLPASIVVTACVPQIFYPQEQAGPGAFIMSAVHSTSAGIVFVVSPVVLLIKCIPAKERQEEGEEEEEGPPPLTVLEDGTGRRRRMGGRANSSSSSSRACCPTGTPRWLARLCHPNPVLSNSNDVLFHMCGWAPRYHWALMVAQQALTLSLFIIFFAVNEMFAGTGNQRMHIFSFTAEFALTSSLCVSFLIITQLAKQRKVMSISFPRPSPRQRRRRRRDEDEEEEEQQHAEVKEEEKQGKDEEEEDVMEEEEEKEADEGEEDVNDVDPGSARAVQWIRAFVRRVSI